MQLNLDTMQMLPLRCALFAPTATSQLQPHTGRTCHILSDNILTFVMKCQHFGIITKGIFIQSCHCKTEEPPKYFEVQSANDIVMIFHTTI